MSDVVLWQLVLALVTCLAVTTCCVVWQPHTARKRRAEDTSALQGSTSGVITPIERERADRRFANALTNALPTLPILSVANGRRRPHPDKAYLAKSASRWAEPTSPPLPLNELRVQPPDMALMQRVLDGLRRLPGQAPERGNTGS